MPTCRYTATIENGGSVVTIPFEPPCRLTDLVAKSGLPFSAPCGGKGVCLRCRVTATGALSAPTAAERAALTGSDLAASVRLACMTQALGDVRIRLKANTVQAVTEGPMPVGSFSGHGYGLAVDVGTTTLAAYLYDLSSGRLLAAAARENPQRAFGADVVTRMDAALRGQNKELQRSVTDAVSALQTNLCEQAGVAPDAVGDRVIVGNTAMLTLLCGQSPASLATAPFEPDDKMDKRLPAADFGFAGAPRSGVYLPPCPAAYVGADAVAALLAADLWRDGKPTVERPTLLADVGTNGELVLVTSQGLLACSAAAGHALEGAGIRCGTVASSGAVSQVALLGRQMLVTVFGGGEATGLCGSGLLDLVAVLGAARVIDREGRLHTDGHGLEDCIRTVDGAPAFFLSDTDVCLTQDDVRAVQLAKAAVRAGIETLLKAAHITADEVDRLLLAGGFGSRLSVPSAAAVGLIPPELAARTETIGNAAGAGACRLLLDPTACGDARSAAASMRVLTLNEQPTFETDYFAHMRFLSFPRLS
ncbi:MAG: DUF4445 domain-containing protein [Clostridia bacterium]|nr:DUF4445 domain-containing protein [Clostridia bacterium]